MGPLANLESRSWFLRELEQFEAGGVVPLVKSEALEGGAFVTPSIHQVETIDENATRYLGTEFFAPNLAVQVVDDAGTAMEICRQSAFGLSMSVFSRDIAVFERFPQEVPCRLFNWIS